MDVVGAVANVAVSDLLQNVQYLWMTDRTALDLFYSLKKELENMTYFMRLPDLRVNKDERISHLKREIKDLVYRVEDVMDTYLMRIESRKGSIIKNTLMRFNCFANDYAAFRKIEAEIRNLSATIPRVSFIDYVDLKEKQIKKKEKKGEESTRILGASDNDEALAKNKHQLLRQTYAHGISDYVGMEKEIDSLVSLMVDEEKACQVICIYGMGGIGKSALAKKLFNHSLIRKHFHAFAWVYVAEDYKREKILEDILKQLLSMESRKKVMHLENIELLLEQVWTMQQEKKCLIVLDDIWSLNAWEDLRIEVPETASKILLTTRIREVANHVSGEKYFCTMRCLDDNEGWELFKRRAFLKEDSAVHPLMDKMGKRILKQCRGLPLAIVMLGDFMGTKHTLREWELMYQNSESYLSMGQQIGGSETVSQVLSLSYDSLPVHLQKCFLHLGPFPEDAEIGVEKLYLLWVAEGNVGSEHIGSGQTMMDLAENYLSELAEKGMIEVQKEDVPIPRRFKSCRLHGLMRELSLLKAKEEEFMVVMDFRRGNQVMANSDAFFSTVATRRLSIYLDNHEDRGVVPLMQEMAKHIHCLFIRTTCEDQQELVWPKEIFYIEEFRLLKVLDFDGLDFRKTKLPIGIEKLFRLRYLSFKGCFLDELPSYIGSLPYLQILDLRVNTSGEMIIPDVLSKIEKLRHLYFPERFQTPNDTKLRLGGLTELETLHGLNMGLCRIKDLMEMPKLRWLTASAYCLLEELKWIINYLDNNSGLRSSLDVRNFDCYTEERHSVLRQLLVCRNLHIFHIEGHIGQLPPKHRISQSLVEIVLSGCELKKDPMATLGKLPDLQVLVLNDEALLVDEIVCFESGYLKLKRLEVSNLSCLKKWRVEDGALPKLSTLTIESCRGLETLPYRLRSLCSLREVKIIKMPPPFEQALRGGWESMYTFQDVPSVPSGLCLSRK